MYKFIVFSPRDTHVVSKIISNATAAGAGRVGNYSHCAFITEGEGTWMPLKGSKPHSGKENVLSKEREVKIEMECPKDKIKAVVQAIKEVHPYDKISIDAVEIARFE